METTSHSYEPSRRIDSFHIRGFQYWDGAFVLAELKPGDKLSLCPEPDNPYDAQAIAIYLGDTKLGYVPREENETLATMFYFGHGDAFEAHVLQVDREAAPWNQVLVAITVTDER